MQPLLPFLLASAVAKPLSCLTQVLSRPEHQAKALQSGEDVNSFRPFIGVLLFFMGKLFTLTYALTMYESITPGFIAKPFTMYFIIGVLLLSPMGLQFFLAYQEFFFYRLCTYQRTLAEGVKDISKLKLTKTLPTLPIAETDQNHSSSDDAPREKLHSKLEELIYLMKNMTEAFGPLLLQNLSLMLIYWLLHVYSLCYFAIETYRALNLFISNPAFVVTKCFQFTGEVLIVRYVTLFV